MNLVDKNLNLELSGPSGQRGRLSDLLERDGSIRYGYNSGGYENFVYFVTGDGETLHVDTVIAEVDFTDSSDRQWHLLGYDVNYEDHSLTDAHTGAKIPAAHS